MVALLAAVVPLDAATVVAVVATAGTFVAAAGAAAGAVVLAAVVAAGFGVSVAADPPQAASRAVPAVEAAPTRKSRRDRAEADERGFMHDPFIVYKNSLTGRRRNDT